MNAPHSSGRSLEKGKQVSVLEDNRHGWRAPYCKHMDELKAYMFGSHNTDSQPIINPQAENGRVGAKESN